MSDAVYDLVGPLHATLVVARIQSGCQNRRRQPSPCLCFHSLNPLCLIDGGPLNPLAKDTEGKGGKFRGTKNRLSLLHPPMGCNGGWYDNAELTCVLHPNWRQRIHCPQEALLDS